jgi:hypothetical protein
MAGNTTSFGLLKPHYEITQGRVTISRNIWVPFLLLAIGIAGAIAFATTIASKQHDAGGILALGGIGAMLGVFALVMTPWFSPTQIVFTREGVKWGGTMHPIHTISKVFARSVELRSSRYGSYLSWSLMVALTNGKPISLSLGNRQRSASPAPLMNLERGIVEVLSGRA